MLKSQASWFFSLFACLCLNAHSAGKTLTPDKMNVGSLRMSVTQVLPEQVDSTAEILSNLYQIAGLYGYEGLPSPEELEQQIVQWKRITDEAHRKGIRKVIGYQCATSLVGDPEKRTKWFDFYDRYWKDYLGYEPSSSPMSWLQVGIDGRPLQSWYSEGVYSGYYAVCHNHPDWQKFHKALIDIQFRAGFDGVFYDNPNKHPDGCYCQYCMEDFRAVLKEKGIPADSCSTDQLRSLTREHKREFMASRLRSSVSFIREMKSFANSLCPNSIIYYNNSLNAPYQLYANAREWGFSIWNWSKYQDLIMVEDSASHPRKSTIVTGREYPAYRETIGEFEICEYASAYKLLHGIGQGRPVTATSIVDGCYLQPPELIQLGMAEATGNQSIYVVWTMWTSDQESINPQIRKYNEFLIENQRLWQDSRPLNDAILLLPLNKWLETDECKAYEIATRLCAADIQFEVIVDGELSSETIQKVPVLFVEEKFEPDAKLREALDTFREHGVKLIEVPDRASPEDLRALLKRSGRVPLIKLENAPFLRAYVRQNKNQYLVHLVNYDVERVELSANAVEIGEEIADSFLKQFPRLLAPSRADVKPANDVVVQLNLPDGETLGEARLISPDCDHEIVLQPSGLESRSRTLSFSVPQVKIYSILIVEKKTKG